MPDPFARPLLVPPPSRSPNVSRRFLAAALLLGASGWATAETLALAIEDLDLHGYRSPLVAMARLQAVSDRPGPSSPVDAQLLYHATLAQLAVHGKHKNELDTAIAQLKRLTDGGCKPCGAQLLVVRMGHAEVHNQPDAVRPLLEQLSALPASADLRIEAERLGMLSRGRAQLDEDELAVNLGAQAVATAAKAGLPAVEARLMYYLARVQLGRGDMENGLRVANECYALAERIGFRYVMAQTRINQNYAYATLEDVDKSHAALLDILRITDGTPGTEALAQIAANNLAAHYIRRGDYAQAIPHTHAAEKLARQSGDNVGLAFAISNRGSALAGRGRVDEGMALMDQAMTMVEQAGTRRIVLDLLSEQVNVLERAGRDRQALAALRKVVKLSGDITTAEREKAVLELQEKFSAESKTREIERLSLSKQLWAAVAVALLLSTVLLVQWVRMVRRRNRSLVVDNAALTSQSIHDPLTGAFNRRHFEQLMAQQEATVHGRSRDRNYQAAVGLLLLDVDHFKRVNDTHGHAAGDAVLKAVAERLRKLVREQDAVVRWGGEEFVLVLPGTPPEGLPIVAAKALHALGTEPVVHEGVEIPVRASAGAIAWPAWPTQNWNDALHIADIALYLSKTGGRNRANCFMGVREGADLGRVHADLAGAAADGEVNLQVVQGPE